MLLTIYAQMVCQTLAELRAVSGVTKNTMKAALEFDIDSEEALFEISRKAVAWYEANQTFYEYLASEMLLSKESPRGKTLAKLVDVFNGILKQHDLKFEWDLKDKDD
jgi:hypothetical protein